MVYIDIFFYTSYFCKCSYLNYNVMMKKKNILWTKRFYLNFFLPYIHFSTEVEYVRINKKYGKYLRINKNSHKSWNAIIVLNNYVNFQNLHFIDDKKFCRTYSLYLKWNIRKWNV